MESFNARYLSYQQVADSFITNENYNRLLHPCHTIVMGPRGCGKTTLLKMLHPRAKHNNPEIENVPFWGIYIPSDKQWAMQIEMLKKIYPDDENIRSALSKAFVNLNFLYALCDTFEAILETSGISDGRETYNFYEQIISAWNIEKPIAPTIGALKVRFKSEMAKISTYVNGFQKDFNLPLICQADFLITIALAIEIFEENFCRNSLKLSAKKWAVCIDEMEFSPEWLQNYVFECLRSTDQKIIFKITSIPTPHQSHDYFSQANEVDDYEIIRSWIYNDISSKEWVQFCKRVIKKEILIPFELEIESFIEHITAATYDSFNRTKQERLDNLLKELISLDKSFHDYALNHLKLDVLSPNSSKISKRMTDSLSFDALFERLSLLKTSDANNHTHYHVYMKTWLLYEFSDGSPRTFINLIRSIKEIYYKDLFTHKKTVKIPELASLIRTYSQQRIYKKLAYYPTPEIEYGKRKYNYKEILDAIGNYFHAQLSMTTFEPLPVNFFIVDKLGFEKFVTDALAVGAIMVVDDSTQYKGVRKTQTVYRLNYGLYPNYLYVKTNARNVVPLSKILEYKIK